MSRRYSRIRQGAVYNEALQRYVTYLTTAATRPRRLNSQGARGTTQTVYLTPFGFDIATDETVSAKVNPDHYTALSTYINGASTGASVSNAIGANTLVTERGFRPARIVWFSNATRSVAVATSDVTGIQYLKYNGDRQSCPFGRNTATDDEVDAFNGVKAAILQATASRAVNRVSLSREKSPT